ncbi:MAG: autoinducer synthase [Rhodobacteraceae bacterium]|nr:autoinducer synthase [Paracoccaceae bacterium]
MLRYVYADQLDTRPNLGNSMFRDRAIQFGERLSWDVKIDNTGCEKDQYDEMNPLYVVWQLPNGLHGGSMRVLPTTAPCMVNDRFSQIAGGPITSPLIWESTRFCLCPSLESQKFRVSAAIMLGGCEIGLNFGLRHAVGVFDRRMVRIYSALGWSPEILGSAGTGRQKISVGLWEFSLPVRNQLLARAGITPEVSARWFDQAFGVSELAEACA